MDWQPIMKCFYLFTVDIVLCCFSSFFGTETFSFLSSRIIQPYNTVWIRETENPPSWNSWMSVFNKIFHSFSCFVFLVLPVCILVNRLTFIGEPVYLLLQDKRCPFYSTISVLYYIWHKEFHFLLCFPYFLISEMTVRCFIQWAVIAFIII